MPSRFIVEYEFNKQRGTDHGDYSKLQSLFTHLENVERGYDADKVRAALDAVHAECASLGVTFQEGRKLASIIPGVRKIEVTGPAYVLTDGITVRQFATAEEASAANRNQAWRHYVAEGDTQSFAAAA